MEHLFLSRATFLWISLFVILSPAVWSDENNQPIHVLQNNASSGAGSGSTDRPKINEKNLLQRFHELKESMMKQMNKNDWAKDFGDDVDSFMKDSDDIFKSFHNDFMQQFSQFSDMNDLGAGMESDLFESYWQEEKENGVLGRSLILRPKNKATLNITVKDGMVEIQCKTQKKSGFSQNGSHNGIVDGVNGTIPDKNSQPGVVKKPEDEEGFFEQNSQMVVSQSIPSELDGSKHQIHTRPSSKVNTQKSLDQKDMSKSDQVSKNNLDEAEEIVIFFPYIKNAVSSNSAVPNPSHVHTINGSTATIPKNNDDKINNTKNLKIKNKYEIVPDSSIQQEDGTSPVFSPNKHDDVI